MVRREIRRLVIIVLRGATLEEPGDINERISDALVREFDTDLAIRVMEGLSVQFEEVS